MKKSRFSEEKIIAILKQLDAGAKAMELARKHGVSDASSRRNPTEPLLSCTLPERLRTRSTCVVSARCAVIG